MGAHTCYGPHAGVRGLLHGAGSLLPPFSVFQGWNLPCQVVSQPPLPTEPSCLPIPFLFLGCHLPLRSSIAFKSRADPRNQPAWVQILAISPPSPAIFRLFFLGKRESEAVSLSMPCLLIYEVELLKGLNYLHLGLRTVTIECEERTS